jgi:DNA integrity scanning protein DisA with diadenylate cyclase activity
MTKQKQKSKNFKKPQKTPVLSNVTQSLVRHLDEVMKECGASVVFVYADALTDARLELDSNDKYSVYYVTRTAEEDMKQYMMRRNHLRVPDVALTRMGQIKIAMLLAFSKGVIKAGDTVVFLSGVAASGTLDTLIVMEVGNEFEMFQVPEDEDKMAIDIKPTVLSKLIDISSELGSEGREGKPVGALFVVGDSERVISLSRQLILNPFQGYSEQQRNVLDPNLEETIKEFSSLDGAFIIDGDGTVRSSGVHLKVGSTDEVKLPQGLGARHHAAAGITSLTDAVAIAVSESTGTVTIFKGGKIVTEIEKLRTLSA